MKRLSAVSTSLFVSAASVLFGGAAFAATPTTPATPTYSAFDHSMKSELAALKIPSTNIGQLSVTQVAQLSDIVDGARKAPIKTAMAEFLVSESLAPSTLDLTAPDGMKIVGDLKAKLAALSVPYPSTPLTAVQVHGLLAVLADAPANAKHEAKVIEAVLASIRHPTKAAPTPSPILVVESDLDAKVTALGLKAPEKGMMTYARVGQLETILASTSSPADQKTSIMKVLSLD
ncbi:MAG: hypothetical protein H7245_14740 [Candidatus Saccharibacteria bacterium]|nr:hypothetical protein [Pseudorhodobacter sp.]